jgi:hypothetical protein
MADVTPAAPVQNAAPPAASGSPSPKAAEVKPEAQPPAQEVQEKAPANPFAPKKDPEEHPDRRAAAAARVARDEKRLYQEREQLRAERERWESERKSQNPEIERYKAIIAEGQRLAKEDPRKFLAWGGIREEQLAAKPGQPAALTPADIERMVSERVSASLADHEAKAKAAREEAEGRAQRERLNEQAKTFTDHSKKQIRKVLDENAEKYEYASFEEDTAERAWKLIEDNYAKWSDPKTGKFRDDAPEEVQALFQAGNEAKLYNYALEYVESQLEAKASKYTAAKKMKSRLEAEKKSEEEKKAKESAERKTKGFGGPNTVLPPSPPLPRAAAWPTRKRAG